MKNRLKIVIICSILIISNKYLFSQTLSDLHFEKFNKVFPKKSVKKINWYTSKKSNIQKNRLKRYDKSQIRLFKKLCKINPSQADALYLNWALSKRKLNDEFRNTNYKGDNVRYNSMHDSLVNVVSFIDHKDNFKNGSSSSSIKDNLKSALDKENALNNYFRNQTSLMKKVTMEHPELSKDFINLNKNSFYFLQENKYVDDYFSSLRCIKKELIENISHQVGFKDYFSVNSFLAGKFSPPENWGSSTKNLQTVQSVKHEEQIAYNHLSSELKKEIPTNILDGKNKIAKIKSKYPQVKNISELPSFKPNTLKGKPFQSRIHTGFDFQFIKQNDFVPIGITTCIKVNYQLISEGFLGIGFAYKTRFKHTNVNETSLRSSFDYQLHNKMFLTGGYEITNSAAMISTKENHIQNQKNILGISGYNSCPIGLKFRNKYGSLGALVYSLQLDLLHDQHAPQTSFIVSRLGWEF